MKILITGAGGQLGADMQLVLKEYKDIDLYPLAREAMDITDRVGVLAAVQAIGPEIIVHTAAVTDVDGCELNPGLAYKVNALGTRNLAEAAESCRAKIMYISTDYVFDGLAQKPYCEDDLTRPINVYGASKLDGENVIRNICTRFFIVRTAWLFGWVGNNFVKTILRLAKDQGELQVVDDQLGSPTFSYDLARLLAVLLRSDAYGIYHAANTGACSWYQFAEEILKVFHLSGIKVKPIKTAALNRPAPRPAYSVLANQALQLHGFPLLPDWQDGLRRFRAGCTL